MVIKEVRRERVQEAAASCGWDGVVMAPTVASGGADFFWEEEDERNRCS
jgi:EREBP-like factor